MLRGMLGENFPWVFCISARLASKILTALAPGYCFKNFVQWIPLEERAGVLLEQKAGCLLPSIKDSNSVSSVLLSECRKLLNESEEI